MNSVARTWVMAGVLSVSASALLAGDLPAPVDPALYPTRAAESALLGRDLFFDPILSGNRNIACATCHHPSLGTGDAMSLSLGEGGLGLGPARVPDPGNAPLRRLPRNAPALYNLGAADFTTLFHDGRVQADATARFGVAMPPGLSLERAVTSPLAAQAMVPLLSHDEMAGQPGENPIATAVAAGKVTGDDGAWALLATRVSGIAAYRARFAWIKGDDSPVHITDIGNALAHFIAFEFRSTDSPYDAFLRGDDEALDNTQLRGLSLFYGKAQCATCHSGAFQTDHGFHAIGIPPIGPGKGHGPAYADHGRGFVTGDPADRYKFRTPSLRNVTLTAPYGHNGAYTRLRDMVRHHLDPLTMLAEYTLDQARLHDVSLAGSDGAALDDFDEMLRIGMSVGIAPVDLSETEVDAILAFLKSLEDPVAARGRLGTPTALPSGLAVDPPAAPSDLQAATHEADASSG